jgi:hypothetical protein
LPIENEDMFGIFIAMGPKIKEGVKIGPVDNIHVYSPLCEMMKINPAQTDGNISAFSKILE